MTYNEAIQTPEIMALKPQLDAVGIDYDASVEKAVNAAYDRQFAMASPKEEIISFVIGFLVKLIDDKMATPAKRKSGLVTRFVWGILRIIGIKQRAINEANKL